MAGPLNPIVIGFCGPIGCGKSTAARRLQSQHGFISEPFAGPLKKMFASFLHLRGVPPAMVGRMLFGDLKEASSHYLGGASPRRAMQLLGTEWGRALFSELWVDAWKDSVRGALLITCDDCRFPNEEKTIKSLGGFLVKIERSDMPLRKGEHASERYDLTPDYTIFNGAEVKHLEAAVDQLLMHIAAKVRHEAKPLPVS